MSYWNIGAGWTILTIQSATSNQRSDLAPAKAFEALRGVNDCPMVIEHKTIENIPLCEGERGGHAEGRIDEKSVKSTIRPV